MKRERTLREEVTIGLIELPRGRQANPITKAQDAYRLLVPHFSRGPTGGPYLSADQSTDSDRWPWYISRFRPRKFDCRERDNLRSRRQTRCASHRGPCW